MINEFGKRLGQTNFPSSHKKIKSKLDFNAIIELRLARKGELIKILGRGELKAKLKISAHKFTRNAKAAIEAVGGESITL